MAANSLHHRNAPMGYNLQQQSPELITRKTDARNPRPLLDLHDSQVMQCLLHILHDSREPREMLFEYPCGVLGTAPSLPPRTHMHTHTHTPHPPCSSVDHKYGLLWPCPGNMHSLLTKQRFPIPTRSSNQLPAFRIYRNEGLSAAPLRDFDEQIVCLAQA